MKKILLCCLMAVMALAVNAANDKNNKKKQTETKRVVFVTDIDCEHCAKKILDNVPVLGRGVEDIKVDLPTKEVTVVYDAAKTNPETLSKNFQKIKVKAEPKAEQQ